VYNPPKNALSSYKTIYDEGWNAAMNSKGGRNPYVGINKIVFLYWWYIGRNDYYEMFAEMKRINTRVGDLITNV